MVLLCYSRPYSNFAKLVKRAHVIKINTILLNNIIFYVDKKILQFFTMPHKNNNFYIIGYIYEKKKYIPSNFFHLNCVRFLFFYNVSHSCLFDKKPSLLKIGNCIHLCTVGKSKIISIFLKINRGSCQNGNANVFSLSKKIYKLKKKKKSGKLFYF